MHPGIQQFLSERLGLELASLSPGMVKQAIAQRQHACGARTHEDYWKRLEQQPREQMELLENLVVPETWFFRDPEAFEMLSEWVRRHWIEPKMMRPLRLLSLACSTGEEPYSMAMALLEAGLPPEQICVHAIDISHRALTQATTAVYGHRSWRKPIRDLREKYFQMRNGHYALQSCVRDRVRFFHANLLDPSWTIPIKIQSSIGPDPALRLAGISAMSPTLSNRYEIVFCRNVMIYLHSAAREQALSVIKGLLDPSGVLFTGPAEGGWLVQCGFSPIGKSRAFAFQRNPVKASRNHAISHPPAQILAPVSAKLDTPKKEPSQAQSASAKLKTPSLMEAQKLADAGQLDAAAALCEQLLKNDMAKTEAHYLLGVIHGALGHEETAEQHYRKAIYLEPHHTEALAHLALIAEHRGDHARARIIRQRSHRARNQTPHH